MLFPINAPFGLFVFKALCFGGVAGGLYVRRNRLSAHFCQVLNISRLGFSERIQKLVLNRCLKNKARNLSYVT